MDTTGKTHIRPWLLVPVTALAGTNVQIYYRAKGTVALGAY